jgi:Smg protein
MKEDVLDVLMYLFQNYMSDDDDSNSPDRESVETELLEAGFPSAEINQAFDWLDGLAARQETPVIVINEERSFRVFTAQELVRLDVQERGFLLFLEQAGVLSSETRELVIDRVMALETDEIDLTQLKWIILMVLFNQPGQEDAYAWMEDLMFEDIAGYLH